MVSLDPALLLPDGVRTRAGLFWFSITKVQVARSLSAQVTDLNGSPM